MAQIPMKEGAVLGIWIICTQFEVCVCSYVEWSSMKVDQFFLKMTTRGEISLRDIAYKITFFQSLKRLLLRTLDVNITKLCNI